MDDLAALLEDHPILASLPQQPASLELSTSTLPDYVDSSNDGPAPSGRRQVMVLKDADLILAVGSELRIASLSDTRKTHKTLHTPNIQFAIHQLALSPSGKLLAVAGATQVAVVVLPRAGFSRLVTSSIECKSVQVGQFYHATRTAAPIVKIDWHPWGEAGSTLMVMTVDGKLREYDISVDTEEPQQVLSFVPERKSMSFVAEDASEREVASFTLGKGSADWGPLTVYAVMRSGDVYAICPYMPKNASIPSAYVHSLECFISAKQEFLSQGTSAATQSFSTLYDYQHKYISALIKQLPPGTHFPAASRSVLMHPPTTIKSRPVRQGPFLLQPSPRLLDGSEGGDATDITYLAFGTDGDDDGEGETERLGVIALAYQDGKVDICLDVDKVEALWENKQHPNNDLPMLAVYETIDLGLIALLNRVSPTPGDKPILDLLHGNHPVFLLDPIHDDTLYIHHAFGVHSLHLGPVLQTLAVALRAEDDDEGTALNVALQKSASTVVQPILTTFSVERKCSNPVVAVAIPNDVYLIYSIFILTSAMRLVSFSLNFRSESPRSRLKSLPPDNKSDKPEWLVPADGPQTYISLLTTPFEPPAVLSRPLGLPSNPRLALGSPGKKAEFMLTPDTLRYLGTTVERFSAQIHEIQLAHRAAILRTALQQREFARQQVTCGTLLALIEQLRGPRHTAAAARAAAAQEAQKKLLGRLDRMLQGLMEKASPALSEYETKWFEELKRMRTEIAGAGKYDEGSLASRAALLEKEYARLLPNLKTLLEKEAKRKNKLGESTALGASQAFELGERSSAERVKIGELEAGILKLAAKLDIPLDHPPSKQAKGTIG